MSVKPKALAVATFVILAALIIGGVFQLGLRSGLDRLERSGRITLEQAADRLIAQLESYRELANFAARHPQIIAEIEGRGTTRRTSEYLLRTALISGAKTIHVLDKNGTIIASSSFEDNPNAIGSDLSWRADLIAAATGRMGAYHSADAKNERGYYLTRGVLGPDKRPQGFVVIKVNMDELEYTWRIDENVVTFFDTYGVAFVSNRLGLALTKDAALAQMPLSTGARATYPEGALSPFPQHSFVRLGGRTLWKFDDQGTMPARALIVSQDVPLIEMTARSFLDISGVVQEARLQAFLTAALLALMGLGFFVFWQGRARMEDQWRIEAQANAVLEARVEKRNAQLQRAQDDLVQASKLTALGEMSAGISHELNQPLSAIQNYAENAKKLIARDRTMEADENLSLISEQIQRMGRIIHNLRGFARKETEPLETVDVTDVLEATLTLSAQRAKSEGVTLHPPTPTTPIWVEAGQVRLQQVIINLLSNAMDALAESPVKDIFVELSTEGDHTKLVVRDTGPGLADTSRAFEPFYTTKEIGASKGLGLGLSISYGIIGSFGGTLSVENARAGGAVFTITLPLQSAIQEAAQ